MASGRDIHYPSLSWHKTHPLPLWRDERGPVIHDGADVVSRLAAHCMFSSTRIKRGNHR
jgi:hypothetical protein